MLIVCTIKSSDNSIDKHEKNLKIMTTSFILVFVFGGIIILGSSVTEKAMGRVEAKAYSENGFATFSNAQTHLEGGTFVQLPTPSGTSVYWKTAGTGPFSGLEQGYVQYDIAGGMGKIAFYFVNPTSGQNTCKVAAPSSLSANCTITQGNIASAIYVLCDPKASSQCKLNSNKP